MRIARGISVTNTSKPISTAPAYDADATAFFTAAGITDTTQKSAVNALVINLKSANIWTKMKAIYPIVGGTATTHKWNLKDPRDLNAAFRLTFSTGWTHSSNGMLPNGTSAYADTFLSTSVIGLNSGHLSYYSRTDSTGTYGEMGALKNTPNSYTDLGLKTSTGAYFRYNTAIAPASYATVSDSLGLYVGTRTASNVLKLFKNGSNIQSLTTISNATTTVAISIGANNNNGTRILYSNRECAFASIGDGLTDTEADNFYTAVQNYQTTLGRQV